MFGWRPVCKIGNGRQKTMLKNIFLIPLFNGTGLPADGLLIFAMTFSAGRSLHDQNLLISMLRSDIN